MAHKNENIEINNQNKTGHFLDAIQKYADEQKHKIELEVEEFKAQELKKAEDEGLKDAYILIQKEMQEMKSGIRNETAKLEREGREVLFKRRVEITDDVFKKAYNKLCEYAKSEKYIDTLIKYSKELATAFYGFDCVVYIKEEDAKYKDIIMSSFDGCNIKFEVATNIKIGGIAAYCQKENLYIDNTLDTKLKDQKEWFLTNSNLKLS